jgi:hypothetical protein
LHALSLLGLPQRPTALFCANDLKANGALDAARECPLVARDSVAPPRPWTDPKSVFKRASSAPRLR